MKDFQAFTIKYNGLTNVLFGQVRVSQAYDPKLTINPPTIMETRAIWDTGASCTVITKKLATQVGLIPTGKTTITGVNHTTEENTYLVNVFLPNGVCLGFVKIAEVPGLTGGAGMLIGMDIICSGDFSIFTDNGKTVMTYRYPSVGGIDFVVEAGNIKSSRAIMQKIEVQQKNRKPLSAKEIRKRKQERKDRKKKKMKRKKR